MIISMKHIIPRLQSGLRYLSKSDPIWNWRLKHSLCPSCNGKIFISLRTDAFMSRCLKCYANVVNLSLIPVIRDHSKLYSVNTCWEMSTYGATLTFLIRPATKNVLTRNTFLNNYEN